MPNNKNNCFVVIPVHNRKVFTLDCLESLSEQSVSNFTIIIVDDGSTDGTSEAIKEKYPDIILLKGNGDFWWSKSVNLGIKYALENGAENIITFNDDLIIEKHCIEELLAVSKIKPNSLIGCFGTSLMNIKNSISQGALKLDWFLAKIRTVSISQQEIIESDILPARGLLIPKTIIDEIGQFDDKSFPQNIADYDFSLRARKRGFKLFAYKKAIVKFYDKESASSKYKQKKSLTNLYYMLFSIKSAGNLKSTYKFAFRHCPKVFLISYLLLITLRISLGFFKPDSK